MIFFQVQSDKASVTITSRYDGVVKKLHFDVEQVRFAILSNLAYNFFSFRLITLELIFEFDTI
jgi:hypothetical protein